MFDYPFPIIETIDDVLPAIEGYDEFIVADRGDHTILNYQMGRNHTFDMDGPDDLMGALRRECRGLIFDASGKLIRRPFHKFFNVGERTETMPENLPMSEPYEVYDKADGSMIAPFFIGGTMRLGTKMGLTDIAKDAEDWLAQQSTASTKVMRHWVLDGYTPLFEWVSPDNKIVLHYDEPRLVYLGLRNMRDGTYIKARPNVFENGEIFGEGLAGTSEKSMKTFLSIAKAEENMEGYILRWKSTGHMVKCKNEWYLQIHRVKDQVRTMRHVLKIILDEKLDDALPFLDEVDRKRVTDFEENFWDAYVKMRMGLQEDILEAVDEANTKGTDPRAIKKALATEILPASDIAKEDYGFAFGVADGKPLGPMFKDKVFSATTNTARFEAVMKWLGVEADE